MKNNYRTFLFMAMPCLLLLAMALYMSNPKKSEFRSIIIEPLLIPVTAEDLSEGWDTKVVFTYKIFGVPPVEPRDSYIYFPASQLNYSLVSTRNDKSINIAKRLKETCDDYGRDDDHSIRAVTTLRLKIRDISRNSGPLELRISARSQLFKHSTLLNNTPTNAKQISQQSSLLHQSKASPVKILVRSN